MKNSLPPFLLERYFARYEFKTPYLLSASDSENLGLHELLDLADSQTAGLWQELSLGYTESAGHPLLREAIAGLYRTVSPEDILVLAPEEGIFIAMHVLLSPVDEVIAVSPAYQSLIEVARSIGCTVRPWPLLPAEGGWKPDLEALPDLITPRTRLLVLNFPHNPTGSLPTLTEMEGILALAERHGLWVFSDEMYRLLEYEESRRIPAICDSYERGITLSGVSKNLALPGLRIGWLASKAPGLIERCLIFKDYTTICSSAPSEVLALIGLRARQAILNRNLGIIRHNLSASRSFFDRHPDLFRWFAPQAGSVAFPEWSGPGTVETMCQALVDKQGVMLVPGSLFGWPGNNFRLGLGRRNFPEALALFEQALAYVSRGTS